MSKINKIYYYSNTLISSGPWSGLGVRDLVGWECVENMHKYKYRVQVIGRSIQLVAGWLAKQVFYPQKFNQIYYFYLNTNSYKWSETWWVESAKKICINIGIKYGNFHLKESIHLVDWLKVFGWFKLFFFFIHNFSFSDSQPLISHDFERFMFSFDRTCSF